MTRLACAIVLGLVLGACPDAPEPPAPRCEPDSAELAALPYEGVQNAARERRRCLLVCYGPYARRICPR